MLQTTVQSKNRNPLFFTRRGMNPVPRMVNAGCRRRPIFLAANHLGPDARLTSVGIEGKSPADKGWAWILWPVDIWRNAQKDRHQLSPAANHGAIPGALITFAAHFLAEGPFSRAISGTRSFSGAILGTMPSLRYYNRHIFSFETRFRPALASKRKNVRRPKPPACPPSWVETPVCGSMRRRPCSARRVRCEAGRGGLKDMHKTT
jgi:hypothetical protein